MGELKTYWDGLVDSLEEIKVTLHDVERHADMRRDHMDEMEERLQEEHRYIRRRLDRIESAVEKMASELVLARIKKKEEDVRGRGGENPFRAYDPEDTP